MTTFEDFESAPVGATATHPDGRRAVKTLDPDGTPWYATDYSWFSDSDIGDYGYVLDHVSDGPKNAEEALDLAWELAHPVNIGDTIPEGVDYLLVDDDSDKKLRLIKSSYPIRIQMEGQSNRLRTLEPIKRTLPDWTKAPAVIARVDCWAPCADPQVFARRDYYDAPSEWRYNGVESYPWQDLRDVTPLYPKEQDA